MKTIAKFPYKHVDMLVTARTVLKSFENHKVELLPLRSNWTDAYIDQLKERINYAMSHYMAQDPRKDLKQATLSLTEVQTAALKNLSMLKVQLEMDFAADKPRLAQLLGTLGYTAFYADARSGDQEALIQLLYTFGENCSNELRVEITANGVQDSLLSNIIAAADPMREANVSQESFKTVAKELTAEAVEEFNAIYKEIMRICRIAAKVFSDKPLLKDKFTFRRVAKRLNFQRKKVEIEVLHGNPANIGSQIIDPNLRDDLNPDSPPADS